MKPLITNIQRFCVHDGPGIRTTVFFKGCSLHCPWCANPENIKFEQQVFVSTEKCKESCQRTSCCEFKQKQQICEADINLCCYGVFNKVGRYYAEDELYNEILKDKSFYQNEGGVTFSGGECLLFLDKYEEMIKKLHENLVSVCVETSLFVPFDKLVWAVSNVDYFYVDIKILDMMSCKEILGGDLDIFLHNLKFLYENIDSEKLIYRIPLVKDVIYETENMEKIVRLINLYTPKQVEIFSAHNLGEKKYERLQKEYHPYYVLESEDLSAVKDYLSGFVQVPIVVNQM